MPHQPETACGTWRSQGGSHGASQPFGLGGRLSRSPSTTRPIPQSPCPGGASGSRNCGKTPPNLWKSPAAWGNPPLISRSNAQPADLVARAAETLDLAPNPAAWTGSEPQVPRLGPIGPCVGPATETAAETGSGKAQEKAWPWPQPAAGPSPPEGTTAGGPSPWGSGEAARLRWRWAWLLAARVRGPRGWSAWG